MKKYNSPNHYNGRNGWKADIIVNHITVGSFTSAINTFMNKGCEVSSHFIISKTGEVAQMVDLQNGAWGNGTTINNDKRDYRKSASRLVRERKTNANYFTYSIEHENAGGGVLTEAQLKASIEVHKFIISEAKRLYGIDIPIDSDHIIGHCDVNPINKPNCPGANFPFSKILTALKGGSNYYEYTVQNGESFWSIAAKLMGSGAKCSTLATFNGLTITSVIHPGQILKIPK